MAINLTRTIVMTRMIIIVITIDTTTTIDVITTIATITETVLVTSICDGTGIAAIVTSLIAISKRLMITIAIKRQSTTSCTVTLAPKAPALSLESILI